MTNIGTTRSSVAYLIEVLVKIARELDEQHLRDEPGRARPLHETAVHRLTNPSAPLPDFSGFHPAFRDRTESARPRPEGDVRRAFFLAYDDSLCEYLHAGARSTEKLDAGQDVVSATFVTPYPPGFPVLVPGQVFSRQILSVHGQPGHLGGARPTGRTAGYRVYTDKALEIAQAARTPLSSARSGRAALRRVPERRQMAILGVRFSGTGPD